MSRLLTAYMTLGVPVGIFMYGECLHERNTRLFPAFIGYISIPSFPLVVSTIYSDWRRLKKNYKR